MKDRYLANRESILTNAKKEPKKLDMMALLESQQTKNDQLTQRVKDLEYKLIAQDKLNESMGSLIIKLKAQIDGEST